MASTPDGAGPPRKTPWRDRANPRKVKLARFITGVILLVGGILVEAAIWTVLVNFGIGLMGLIPYSLYLFVGALFLVSTRNVETEDEPSSELPYWSSEVVSRSIRGAERNRNIILQIIAWLIWGHFMASLFAIYGILEVVSSFGF